MEALDYKNKVLSKRGEEMQKNNISFKTIIKNKTLEKFLSAEEVENEKEIKQ